MNNHLGARPRRCRVIGFLMAREYYEIPGLTWIGRAMQCIAVNREGKDMRPAREALERLRRGDLIGVFPEGGINEGDRTQGRRHGHRLAGTPRPGARIPGFSARLADQRKHGQAVLYAVPSQGCLRRSD